MPKKYYEKPLQIRGGNCDTFLDAFKVMRRTKFIRQVFLFKWQRTNEYLSVAMYQVKLMIKFMLLELSCGSLSIKDSDWLRQAFCCGHAAEPVRHYIQGLYKLARPAISLDALKKSTAMSSQIVISFLLCTMVSFTT